jgi:FSR family fosmidomycin resistance protein-like MFS transporter
MTEAPLPLTTARTGDLRVITYVSAAHFVSHYYTMVLPPLFLFVREAYGVTYTELGFALVAFNIMSAVFQTPAGFIVDRVGGRIVLVAGLVLGAAGFAIAGLVNSFWVFIAGFAVAGLGNAVYHPADYSVLSKQVSEPRTGMAYSMHTFSGMLGGAIAPATLLFLYEAIGWRGAFAASALLGLVVASLVAMQPDEPAAPGARSAAQTRDQAPPWRLLLSPVILLNFGFFALLAFTNGGLQNYSVVALAAARGTALTVGNAALSGYLLLAAAGVLIGGVLATRLTCHGLVAAAFVCVNALAAALLGLFDLGAAGTVLAMSIAGLSSGATMPSRDMIVRQVTPPGSFGKVFGFVMSGFSCAGVVAPLVYGPLMDHGYPSAVFLVVAAACLLTLATLATVRGQPRPA